MIKHKNNLYLAVAGAGKTTFLVKTALSIPTNQRVLITTYTNENTNNIRSKIIEKNGVIPENITIQTWISFLTKHGARPYKNYLGIKDILGIYYKDINNKNDGKTKKKKKVDYTTEKKHSYEECYLVNKKIKNHRLAIFVKRCNEESGGLVIDRLSNIYQHIFVDEFQDLVGSDYDLLNLFFNSKIKIILVGDLAQCIYGTHYENKYKNYKGEKILDLLNKRFNIVDSKSTNFLNIDDRMNQSYRSNSIICNFASQIYPNHKAMLTRSIANCTYKGIYYVKKENINDILEFFNSRCDICQLGRDKNTKANTKYLYKTFGKSKGLGFDIVFIYPDNTMVEWIKNKKEMRPKTKSKFYIAVTRARHAVIFLVDKINSEDLEKHGINEIKIF